MRPSNSLQVSGPVAKWWILSSLPLYLSTRVLYFHVLYAAHSQQGAGKRVRGMWKYARLLDMLDMWPYWLRKIYLWFQNLYTLDAHPLQHTPDSISKILNIHLRWKYRLSGFGIMQETSTSFKLKITIERLQICPSTDSKHNRWEVSWTTISWRWWTWYIKKWVKGLADSYVWC